MSDSLFVDIDPEAAAAIAAELGSVNAFKDRLATLVQNESGGRAAVGEAPAAAGTRGGGLVEIATAVSGVIAALTPIVIAWIRSRNLEVEETTEQAADGTLRRTLKLRRGAPT
jgi:hypothetical protein